MNVCLTWEQINDGWLHIFITEREKLAETRLTLRVVVFTQETAVKYHPALKYDKVNTRDHHDDHQVLPLLTTQLHLGDSSSLGTELSHLETSGRNVIRIVCWSQPDEGKPGRGARREPEPGVLLAEVRAETAGGGEAGVGEATAHLPHLTPGRHRHQPDTVRSDHPQPGAGARPEGGDHQARPCNTAVLRGALH